MEVIKILHKLTLFEMIMISCLKANNGRGFNSFLSGLSLPLIIIHILFSLHFFFQPFPPTLYTHFPFFLQI